MAHLNLRDRDGVITREGLIFRVLGYTHPPNGCICDAEYALSELFKSENPKAFRGGGKQVFYKFYEDEGWKFIQKNFPQYLIFYEPLGKKVIGINFSDIALIRRPDEVLRKLLALEFKDGLLRAMQAVLELIIKHLGLQLHVFGVFGSLLHGFYHPSFSDIDLIVYGRSNLMQVRSLLQELYNNKSSGLSNEFEDDGSVRGKVWRFKNISPKEFVWHQKRKLIYGVFNDKASRRLIKVEFEPVKAWNEIHNEYHEIVRITWQGWVKAFMQIEDDSEGPFMPSIYYVKPVEIVDGPKVDDIKRVVSYLEEFRMQAWKDELVYVEGNLEKVETKKESFHQITLTYGPRYYEQVLKVANLK